MRTTLKQAKDFGISEVLNICADDARFLRILNEAQHRLLDAGKWWGTIVRAQICVTDGCMVWPREVGSIEAIAVCRRPIQVQNEWYEFIQNLGGIQSGCVECGSSRGCNCGNLNFLPHGTKCVFRDWSGSRKLRVYPTNAQDVGKTMILQGFDQNRKWIRNEYSGQWIDGEKVTLALPYVETTAYFNGTVNGIQKEQTTNNVLLYAYDSDSNTSLKIGDYQPTEKNPEYITSLIPNLENVRCRENGSSEDCCQYKTITALVKRQFIPAEIDTDWLLIGNLPALKEAMMAVHYWNNGNDEKAEYHFYGRLIAGNQRRGGALGALRTELRSRTADVQEIMVQTQGTANLNKVFGGFI